jgi:phosphatidylinositol glycan class W
VLWVAAYNTTFLFGYLVLEITLFSSGGVPVPSLLEAVNNNGLAVFLAGNVMTGLINLSMRTMYASDTAAVIILIAYSGALCGIAWLGRGVRLKI